MASVEHLALSEIIKSVHQDLREKSQSLGVETTWKRHCADEENLRKYSSAMKELATSYWESPHKLESNVLSRITWTCDTCRNYFASKIIKHRNKERDIADKINCALYISDSYTSNDIKRLKLLDVGSCYNPFQKFEYFDVIGIDIAPATDDVFRCDFLSIKIEDTLITHNKDVLQLPKNYFDVIVFSLVLEYLPSPKQRLICCENAYNLLKTEGLLIIITPDSNHVGVNAKYIKSWRFILAEIGFSRIKYEKLPHIHCMAFRKSSSKEIAQRWAILHKKEQIYSEIFIPQDFKVKAEEITLHVNNEDKYLKEDFVHFMDELPNSDIFQ